MLAKVAEGIALSGDKSRYLISTAPAYLAPNDEALRNAFFRTAATVVSNGDLENVLQTAIAHGHASPAVTMQVIRTSGEISSSGDVSNVLRALATRRALTPGTHAATLAVMDRTLRMGSSGDRANVLITLANQNLLSTTALREAYLRAAMALPLSGDRENVLAALPVAGARVEQ